MIYSAQLFLKSVLCLLLLHTVASFDMKSAPRYRNKAGEVFQQVDLSNQHDFPQVHIRGYAGDDFYQKASKSIPRMGRRSETSAKIICPYGPHDVEGFGGNEELQELINEGLSSFIPGGNVKQKRLHLAPDDVSEWPWNADRTSNSELKRAEMSDLCEFPSKAGSRLLNIETCDDDKDCCPIPNDLQIFKRILSTRGSKQTTTSAPDYKSNQFM